MILPSISIPEGVWKLAAQVIMQNIITLSKLQESFTPNCGSFVSLKSPTTKRDLDSISVAFSRVRSFHFPTFVKTSMDLFIQTTAEYKREGISQVEVFERVGNQPFRYLKGTLIKIFRIGRGKSILGP